MTPGAGGRALAAAPTSGNHSVIALGLAARLCTRYYIPDLPDFTTPSQTSAFLNPYTTRLKTGNILSYRQPEARFDKLYDNILVRNAKPTPRHLDKIP